MQGRQGFLYNTVLFHPTTCNPPWSVVPIIDGVLGTLLSHQCQCRSALLSCRPGEILDWTQNEGGSRHKLSWSISDMSVSWQLQLRWQSIKKTHRSLGALMLTGVCVWWPREYADGGSCGGGLVRVCSAVIGHWTQTMGGLKRIWAVCTPSSSSPAVL